MTAPTPRVVVVDGVPMSGLTGVAAAPRAVVVAVHGGATSSAYFDCPGHPDLSLLRTAPAAGFTVVALDRPGYGASALYADEMADPDRRTALAWGAVRTMLGDTAGVPVFLLAHSAGCELALRMALDPHGADVVGIELAGTGLRYHPDAVPILAEATVTSRPAGLRDLLWQPVALYPPEVLTGRLSAPGVRYEGRVTERWARQDFPALAARVTVPVQFSVAEHEAVWDAAPEAVDAVLAAFVDAPLTRLNRMADSGHNLSVGHTAGVYHQRVLAFVAECTARGASGSDEREAG